MPNQANPCCKNPSCSHYMLQACDADTRANRCQFCRKALDQVHQATPKQERRPVQRYFRFNVAQTVH